jgi:hypothetical protein
VILLTGHAARTGKRVWPGLGTMGMFGDGRPKRILAADGIHLAGGMSQSFPLATGDRRAFGSFSVLRAYRMKFEGMAHQSNELRRIGLQRNRANALDPHLFTHPYLKTPGKRRLALLSTGCQP